MNTAARPRLEVNTNIKALHKALIAQHEALMSRLSDVSSIEEADAIVREMNEINFRVMIAGSLLFKETTEGLDKQLHDVIAATADLNEAIASARKLTALIKATSKFLGLVDKIFDKLKIV